MGMKLEAAPLPQNLRASDCEKRVDIERDASDQVLTGLVRYLRRGATTVEASRAGRSGRPTRRGLPCGPLLRVGLRRRAHVIHRDVENDSGFYQRVHRLRRAEPIVDCAS
jgi:hypothetical protein